MRRSMRVPMTVALLAGALALGGCESNDDDGGGNDGNGGGADGGDMTPGPDMPPTSGGPDEAASGDIFAIAGRGDADEPAALDRAALATQLGGLLGADGDAMEPLDIEDGDDVITALRRREGGTAQ